MQPFESPAHYIDREAQKALLRELAAKIVREPGCIAVYFKANGGLGKTHLLKRLPDILQAPAQAGSVELAALCIAQPVDLYNFETRSPTIIEQHLIDGLCRSNKAEWYRFEPDRVAAAFVPYQQMLAEYRRNRDFGSADQAAASRLKLRQIFVENMNRLTAQRPTILCFDTLETLFNAAIPAEAFVNASDAGTGADLVLEWMRSVLPQLEHTLVLLCGRPLKHNLDQRLLHDLHDILPPEHIQEFQDLQDPDDVRAYLDAYGLHINNVDMIYLRRITENRPLLLTCYAETHRDDGGLARLERPGRFASRAQFEDWLVATILDPLPKFATHEEGQKTLILSLYFLVYARRGIRPAQLLELFQLLDVSFAPAVIDNLAQLALVKTDGERLFLHDEIFRIIDASKQADRLGARDQTLGYLCQFSAQEVRQAEDDRAGRLRAMTDHVYYELLRSIQGGYRVYTIYIDRLLRERNTNSALVLCDAFWTIFSPLRDQLALSPLTYDEVLRAELVRQVKFLHSRDRSEAAVELANDLYRRFCAEGLLPPDDVVPLGDHLPVDPYLYVDLNIERAILMAQSQLPGYEEQVERSFSHAIALLEALDTPTEETQFLYLRRQFFLGMAYTLRGYLRRQQQRFEKALADGQRGRRAFKAYRDDRVENNTSAEILLYDNTLNDLAQTSNNLVYTLALSGDLEKARRRAEEIINRYVPHVSDYRRALFWNTYGLTLMLMGRYLDARRPIEEAVRAAKAAGVMRATGLVSQSLAQLARADMLSRGEPDPAIEQLYVQADQQLQNDKVARFDLIDDFAGFLRDMGMLYRGAGDLARARHYEEQALSMLDQGRALLGGTQAMQIANLCESKATIYINMGVYDRAAALLNEAEAYMHQPMPRYAQVVSGKIALQRGAIALYAQQNYHDALRSMAIGLARIYVFADEHRDQGIFERLIESWLKDIPDSGTRAFWHATESGLSLAVQDLPYQLPAPDAWLAALGKSLSFIRSAIEIHLDL